MKPLKEQFRTIQNYWVDTGWLGRRMLLLSGPRQVGKTTLVQSALCKDKEAYFNWDHRGVRLKYRADPDFISEITSDWICLDEIHKRPKWKDILKGLYDTYKDRFRFVVTGSARLETFQRSGDSLVGRYFHTRLFPVNLPDLHKTDFSLPKNPDLLIAQAADLTDSPHLETLLAVGGFPEPFFEGRESFWRRWSKNHRDLIIGEDLKDLTKVMEVDKIEALLEMIEPSIGQLVSYRNLAGDLETTHGSIRRWLETLNRIQLVFSVSPYHKNVRRAYKMEKKWYYMDWRAAGANIFENYVAVSLLRAAKLYEDRFGDKFSLHFVRTHDGAEVDFLMCREKKPWFLIEAKEGAPDVSEAVYRFSREFNIPCAVVTRKKGIYKRIKGRDGQRIFCISWSRLGRLFP